MVVPVALAVTPAHQHGPRRENQQTRGHAQHVGEARDVQGAGR
jgi:hypothetical protein